MKRVIAFPFCLFICSLAYAETDKPLFVLPDMTITVSEALTSNTSITQPHYRVSTSFVVTNRTDNIESIALDYSGPDLDETPDINGLSDVSIFINGEYQYYASWKVWSAPVFVPANGCSTNIIEFYVPAQDIITNITAVFSLFVSPERRRNENELEANVLDVIIKSTEIPCKTFSDVSQERKNSWIQ